MKQISILGKIIILFFICTGSYAINIVSSIDKETVNAGDTITFTIKAYGDKISLPKIKMINNCKIITQSVSTTKTTIDSTIKNTKIKKYKFIVKNSMIIKPYDVLIDGVIYKTKEYNITVKNSIPINNPDDIEFKLILSKTDNLYVGEDIKATFTVKYKSNIQIVKLSVRPFRPKYFVTKKLTTYPIKRKNGYTTIRQDYIIFPQVAGELIIDEQVLNISIDMSNNKYFNKLKTKKISSKKVILNINPLPNNLQIQGNYTIDTTIDNSIIDANKPINYTLVIKGCGNIDDIDTFKMKLKNEVVYSLKPEISTSIKDDKYCGVFEQKFSIIGQRDFTIPSIKFKYFDQIIKSEKVLETKEYKISVNKSIDNLPQIETKIINKSSNNIKIMDSSMIKYIYLLVGFLLGIFVSFFYIKRLKHIVKDNKPIEIKINKTKSDKELYEILLPYSNQKSIQTIMKLLEDNIYNGAKHTIKKKDIKII